MSTGRRTGLPVKSNLLRAATLAVALVLSPGRGAAETRLVQVPYRFLIVPPMEAGSKRVTKGDDAFDFPMRWHGAAILPHDLELAAGNRTQVLKQGQALPETKLEFTDPSFANARAYCVPRLADPIPKGGFLLRNLVGGAIARSLSDGQFCIIDQDLDGVADHSVLVNAGSPTAREPRPIAPTPYNVTPIAVVSEGDAVRFRYTGGKDSFEFQIVEQGRPRQFQTLQYRDAEGRGHRFERWLATRPLNDGSYAVEAPGLTFTVSGYDPATNSVLVAWPRTIRPRIVPIPDDVKFGYGTRY